LKPNYFSILSAKDTIQTLNGSQNIQLLLNDAAFSNIQPTLKYQFKIFVNFLVISEFTMCANETDGGRAQKDSSEKKVLTCHCVHSL